MRLSFIFSEMWIGLRRNVTMTLGVLVTTAVALTLLGVGLFIWAQVNSMQDFWYNKVEVTVYLCGKQTQTSTCQQSGAITPQQQSQLKSQLESMPQVQHVYYESEAQAYQRFRDQFKTSPVLVENTREGEVPASFRVKLKDPTKYAVVTSAVQGRPGVSTVYDFRAVLGKFFNILNSVRNGALLLAGFGLLAALLLIGNTIRLAAFSRRRETGIMRLVGASNFAIQMPFLMEGAITGFLGGAVASSAVYGLKALVDWKIRPAFLTFAFLGWGSVHLIVVVLLVVGVLLSMLSSFFTIRRYLHV
ncbi:MAG: ABC transporter permease [Streptosporangiales bacterium]|nr:ABC transporter permease [Streptosporangiales bacterium]MBO0890028.1 ABC transporter permease [Acidothermales bacterium]